jgi:hypothetical protein
MSTIAIFISETHPRAEVIKDLRAITGKPINVIRDALISDLPVIECRLAENDHEERAAELPAIVDLVLRNNLSAEAYQIDDDSPIENTSSCSRFDLIEVLEILEDLDRIAKDIEDSDGKKFGW